MRIEASEARDEVPEVATNMGSGRGPFADSSARHDRRPSGKVERKMKRRDFIALVASTVTWPSMATARPRRIGVLTSYASKDPGVQERNAAFVQRLQQLGWTVGQNLQIEYRWVGGHADETRKHAAELVRLEPEVIFASGSAAVEPLRRATHAVPIVFANIVDPVGAGLVESLAHPGNNATGLAAYEYRICAKWLELLKEIAPNVTRAAVLYDVAVGASPGLRDAIESVSPALGIKAIPVNVGDVGEPLNILQLLDIARDLAAIGRLPNIGLIMTGSALAVADRDLGVAYATELRLPAVYFDRYYTVAGGLISYGPNIVDGFRSAADYVDRILRGEKPADLPVEVPTKNELVINLKRAKALGIEVPPTLLARADEVIG